MTTPTTTRPSVSGEPRLIRTKNDLPQATRAEVVALLNQRLADCIDLQTMCKQAHWNVKGSTFYQLHLLFDEVNGAVAEYVDLIAERIVQLGGVAEGTARVVAQRSTLLDYPLTLTTGEEHVAALSDVLAQFGRTVRIGIAEMDELEDAGTVDLLTEVSRGVDKWLWFVEAHQQGAPSEIIIDATAETVAPSTGTPRASGNGASRRVPRKTRRLGRGATTRGRGKR
jgi:starvation-inducible DNA-binding protein